MNITCPKCGSVNTKKIGFISTMMNSLFVVVMIWILVGVLILFSFAAALLAPIALILSVICLTVPLFVKYAKCKDCKKVFEIKKKSKSSSLTN